MTHPYRTAPATAEPQRPWWRRALCAIGSHSLYLVAADDGVSAACEHCGVCKCATRMSVVEYLDAMDHPRSDKGAPYRYRPSPLSEDDRSFVIHRQ